MNNLLVTTSQLVPVFETKIGEAITQACDARALHAYLESRQDFSTWIKSRIEKYEFVLNQDYTQVVDSSTPQNYGASKSMTYGTSKIDYSLTLDMAKELAMVENNAKGREVRQYFIAMEKRVTQYQALTQADIAISTLKAHLTAASLFSCPTHLAQIEAVKQVRSTCGVDFSPYLLSAPAQDNIKPTEVMMEPTELGKLFGLSAIAMNRKLAALGLQTKDANGWIPTVKGDTMCTKHAWNRGSKSGYNIKWNADKIKDILE